jgi:outer membrane protein assembly factor BamB
MSLRNTVIAMLPLCLFLFCTYAAPIAAAAITWRADVGGAVYSTPVFSASGDLYVSSYDGNLYSIAANGSRTWRVFLGPLYYSPLFVQDSRISDAKRSARGSNGSVSLERSSSDYPKVFAGYSIGGEGLGVVAGISSAGKLLFRDTFGVGSLQCAPQYLRGTLLSCDDGGFIVALAGDGRGQLWSADIHGGSVLSNIVVLDNVLDGILCVGGAAHRIVCLDVNGTAIWNTSGGGSSGDFVTVLSSARGGGSLVSGAFCLCVRALPNLLASSSCSGATPQQLLPSRVVLLICLAASFLGHVTSHSSANGDVQWSFNAGSSVTGTATLPTSDGRIDALVVATAAGSVLALSCADGVLLWSAGFEGPVAVAAGQNPAVPTAALISCFFS